MDKKPKKGGRPIKHDHITPEEVYKLAQIGCNTTEIGTWFGVHGNIIRSRFQDQIDRGKVNLKISLRRAQIKNALDGNVTMQIWLGKQLLDQTDDGTVDREQLIGNITFGDVEDGSK